MRLVYGLMALAAGTTALQPLGAADLGDTPEPLARMLQCRNLPDATARLACYDSRAAELGRSLQAGDVVAADKQQIRTARRFSFGSLIPDINIFRGKGDKALDAEQVEEIDAKIATARLGNDGNWVLVLDTGARWVQNDKRELSRDPRPGMAIHIRRAAMGTYLANVDKQVAIRVQRTN